jgi:hypothetical protein
MTRLFKPSQAWRVRWSRWPDTPLPPDEPAGANPPDGAVIDYQVASDARGPVTLEILDQAGKLVRRFSSADSLEHMLSGTNVPSYWIRPPQRIATSAGLHRFIWDLHYPDPKNISFDYPISAIPHSTVKEPRGPWVLPGIYTVRLTVDGREFTQKLAVKMDPRVTTTAAGLEQQFRLSMQLYEAMASHPTQAEDQLKPVYTLLQETDAAPSAAVVAAVRARLAALKPEK